MPVDRYKHTRAILGQDVFDKVANAKLLIVGAGGIGCELIKNLVMTGYGTGPSGSLTVLDLDTIDLSNLNRQFLFQKQHVKRPKAVVARETALKFNPYVKIEALHRNIKDSDFPVTFFQQFTLVLNALDNLDARRHVNRMCLAAGVPLLESGTSGYVGQVQPIFQDKHEEGREVECFDCLGKPVPKTFAVCTIRSTPSTAHHCIAWAKSYLFPQLFGADDEAAVEEEEKELNEAEKNGENWASCSPSPDEIANLRAEGKAVRELRATLPTDPDGAAKRVFDKVYTADIHRLLAMTDMWAHRRPPVPLSWAELSAAPSSSGQNGANGATANGGAKTREEEARIKDQKKLATRESWELFCDAVHRLSVRVAAAPSEPLSFDKDDVDTLDFVVGAANLRAEAFGIESQTKWQVKEYAGNIIPAIATTNAIIAAALVQQSLHFLRYHGTSSANQLSKKAKNIWLTRSAARVTDVNSLSAPNPQCAVCRAVYAPVQVVEDLTLREFVEGLTGEGKAVPFEGMVSVQEGGRILWETEELEDNGGKTMKELGVGAGAFVTVQGEDEEPAKWPVVFCFGDFLPTSSSERIHLLPLPSGAPSIPSPIPTRAPPPAPASKDDTDDDDEPLAVSGSGAGLGGTEDDDLVIVDAAAPEEAKDADLGVGAEGATVKGVKRSAAEAELGNGAAESPKKKREEDAQGDEVVIDLT
ncbi:hypothetical protein JCM8097_008469 [Rhodosporidiobolus ruineniae]